jgi:hypothetical protein
MSGLLRLEIGSVGCVYDNASNEQSNVNNCLVYH